MIISVELNAIIDRGLKINMNTRQLIYDVGMHRGEDTDYYLRKGFQVVGIEAAPQNVAYCRNRFSEAIEAGKLSIVEGAIVANPAQQPNVQFYINENVSVWGTCDENWAARNEGLGTSHKVINVNSINFLEVIAEFGVPYYMKIDIEGNDTVCLEELKKTVERPCFLSIESSKTSYKSIVAELLLFRELGYKQFHAVEQSSIFGKKSAGHSSEGAQISYIFEEGASGPFGKDLPSGWLDFDSACALFKYIWAGYYLLGDKGMLNRRWIPPFVRESTRRLIRRKTGACVPGWYDIHARFGT